MERSRRSAADPVRWRRSSRRDRRVARRSRPHFVGRHPYVGAGLVALVVLTPIWVSLASALTNPSLGPSVSARLAEWARDHGGASVVDHVENLWFAHHQPALGGRPPKGAIPTATRLLPPVVTVGLPPPSPLTSIAQPPLPGEGAWHPAGRLVDGVPAVYEAFLRPDPVHTSLVVGVAWLDTKLLSMTLYSGDYIPGGGPYVHTAPIPPAAARSLVAVFNAGFRVQDADGGYYTDHRVVIPLRAGAASFVIYKNGDATVAMWGRDAKMSPDIASVRQNLDLLVDHGAPVPGLNANDTSKWGFTLGNKVYVWRSGVGVTADGALVYVGGPGLNITSLADLLVRAGSIRAMELDINPAWVDFATFTPTPAGAPATPDNGRDLLPGMVSDLKRYFSSWWTRDFFAASVRPIVSSGGAA